MFRKSTALVLAALLATDPVTGLAPAFPSRYSIRTTDIQTFSQQALSSPSLVFAYLRRVVSRERPVHPTLSGVIQAPLGMQAEIPAGMQIKSDAGRVYEKAEARLIKAEETHDAEAAVIARVDRESALTQAAPALDQDALSDFFLAAVKRIREMSIIPLLDDLMVELEDILSPSRSRFVHAHRLPDAHGWPKGKVLVNGERVLFRDTLHFAPLRDLHDGMARAMIAVFLTHWPLMPNLRNLPWPEALEWIYREARAAAMAFHAQRNLASQQTGGVAGMLPIQTLPKHRQSVATVPQVFEYLLQQSEPQSIDAIAKGLGIARATVRPILYQLKSGRPTNQIPMLNLLKPATGKGNQQRFALADWIRQESKGARVLRILQLAYSGAHRSNARSLARPAIEELRRSRGANTPPVNQATFMLGLGSLLAAYQLPQWESGLLLQILGWVGMGLSLYFNRGWLPSRRIFSTAA